MASTGKKWLIGCGAGCAVSVLLMIIITVGTGIMMTRPFSKAVDAQNELSAAFGEREEYIPLCDGVNADRLEAFLQVRDVMMQECAGFEDVQSKFKAMDDLDNSEEEPSKGDIVKGVGNIMGAVFSIGGKIGDLTLVRNEALLDNGMSLGEYNWLYILIYYSWLDYSPNTGIDNDDDQGLTGTQKDLILVFMENHAADCEAKGEISSAELWRNEASRMQRVGDGGVPFKGLHLPLYITRVLQPYEQDLTSRYCAAMSEFELGSIKKEGFIGFRSE